MERITSVKELKTAIRQLESDQQKQGALLKNEWDQTWRSLRPGNLLRGALEDIMRSPVFLAVGIQTVKSFAHLLIDKVCSRQ